MAKGNAAKGIQRYMITEVIRGGRAGCKHSWVSRGIIGWTRLSVCQFCKAKKEETITGE